MKSHGPATKHLRLTGGRERRENEEEESIGSILGPGKLTLTQATLKNCIASPSFSVFQLQ
jgi:hypothetical protein